MSNENKIISNQAITNLMPVRDQVNKHAKKASDGTMSFMLWSIAGTALAACGGGGGGGGSSGGGGGGGNNPPPSGDGNNPPPSGGGGTPSPPPPADALATAIVLSNIVSTLAEDTTARTKIADISITDRDGGSPGTLEIMVTDTRITSTDATAIVNMFQITGSGNTRVLYLRADQDLDFETLRTLPIRVQLREDTSVGRSVSISVTNVDEPATAIALSSIVSTLAEDTTARTKIADISITDRDGGSPGTLEIIVTDTRITSTDATAIVNMFQITGSGNTREIYLRADQDLDFDTLNTLPIRVQLREDPSVGQSVSISVTDVDETPPGGTDARATAIVLRNIVSTFAEGTTARTKIADIRITDDGGSPGTLEIIVTNPSIALTDATAIVNMFEIIGSDNTRELYLRANQILDFETLNTLPIRVQLREDPSVGQSISISVTDVDETTPEAGPLFSVMELREITGTTSEDRLTGRPNTNELIQGGDRRDRINTLGGNDVAIGGAGEDTITLGLSAETGAETVVYRFTSDGSPNDGSWQATDGRDIIFNFERGVDRLVLVDVNTVAPITSLAELIDDPDDRLLVTVEVNNSGFINTISITFDLEADGSSTTDADARTIQIGFTNTNQLRFLDPSVSPRFTDLGRGEYELKGDNYGYIDDLFGGEDFFKVGDASKLPPRFTILEGPDPAPPAGPLFSVMGLDDITSLTGTAADELIQDSAGSGSLSTINTRGGDDVVIGGLGADTINLGTDTQTGAETVVYRFESDGAARVDGNWQGTDNNDRINNFEYGVDKLVFVDVHDDIGGIPIANLRAFDEDEDRPEIVVVAGNNVAAVLITFASSVTIQVFFAANESPTITSINDHVDQVGRNYRLKEGSSIADLFGGEDFFKVGDASQLPNDLDIM